MFFFPMFGQFAPFLVATLPAPGAPSDTLQVPVDDVHTSQLRAAVAGGKNITLTTLTEGLLWYKKV